MAVKQNESGLAAKINRRLFLLGKRLRAAKRDGQRLVVIAGVQRSGTNMLMDVLEACPVTDVIHERDPRLYDNYMMRPDATVAELRERSPASVLVIKALHEPERVRPLMDRFAPAKAVWLFRHWTDTVNSNMKSWPQGRNRLDDIVKDPALGGWRAAAMPADTLETLRGVYRPDLDQASAQALFYWHRNKLLFDLGLSQDPRVLVMDYDAMVADPQPALERLAGFLDVPLTPRMRRIPDPTAIRKRPAPVIDPTVEALCADIYARMQKALS